MCVAQWSLTVNARLAVGQRTWIAASGGNSVALKLLRHHVPQRARRPSREALDVARDDVEAALHELLLDRQDRAGDRGREPRLLQP